jgi:ABC-2 type transport system permease protein
MRPLAVALIRAIVERDLTVVLRSKAVVIPIVIVPVLLFAVMPALAAIGIRLGHESLTELAPLLEAMPESMRRQLGDGPLQEQLTRYLFGYQFAGLFLIIPLMVAAVIAADSFAGEKERKTLEALLYTPTSDLELYVAKLLGPWLAAIAVSIIGYLLYVAAVGLSAGVEVGLASVVTPFWVIILAWVGPAVAALALGVLVQVSARVRGFQEAYQLGGAIVLPVVALIVAQLAGVLFLDAAIAVLLGAAVWVVAGLVLWLGYRSFRRERLLLSA